MKIKIWVFFCVCGGFFLEVTDKFYFSAVLAVCVQLRLPAGGELVLRLLCLSSSLIVKRRCETSPKKTPLWFSGTNTRSDVSRTPLQTLPRRHAAGRNIQARRLAVGGWLLTLSITSSKTPLRPQPPASLMALKCLGALL